MGAYDNAEDWAWGLREPIAYYAVSDDEIYWAVAYLWGSGGRISFGRVGSDCPIVSFPLRERYWCLGYLSELREPAMKYLKQVASSAAKKVGPLTAEAKALKDRLAALHEYCESVTWPDGRERVTSSVSLFTDGGVWKACLNDRDGELVLFAAEGSMLGVLDALEATLRAGTGDWRHSSWSRAGKSGKRTGKPVDRRPG